MELNNVITNIIQCDYIGKLILPYGNIYLPVNEGAKLFTAVVDARNDLLARVGRKQFSQDYNIVSIDKSKIEPSNALVEQLEKGVNVIIPIYTPDSLESKFVIAKVSTTNVDYKLPLLINQVEQISNDSIYNALVNFAMQEPEAFKNVLKNYFELPNSPRINDDLFSDLKLLFSRIFSPPMMYAMLPVGGAARDGIGKYTFKNIKSFYDRFINNCNNLANLKHMEYDSATYKYKKERILSELKFVVEESLTAKDASIFLDLFFSLPEETRKTRYANFLDRYAIANKSKVKIGIEKFDKIDSTLRADGIYRVYVEYKTQKRFIHFHRSPACIIYIIYLLDRFQNDTKVDSIDIKKCKKLFCNLYEVVYKKSGEQDFSNIIKKVLIDDKRPSQLKDYMISIRDAVDDTFKELSLDMSEKLPFTIPSIASHLTVRRKNITVNPLLLDIYESSVT